MVLSICDRDGLSSVVFVVPYLPLFLHCKEFACLVLSRRYLDTGNSVFLLLASYIMAVSGVQAMAIFYQLGGPLFFLLFSSFFDNEKRF